MPANFRPTDSKVLVAHLLLALACLVSRLISSIYYIEDTDSLRFALALIDYDVTNLQPHFPGYPLFCFVGRLLYLLLDSYALAFAVMGAAATYLLVVFSLRLAGVKLTSPAGALIAIFLFLNPLLWLMSNRYMPDLAATALAVAALSYLCDSVRGLRGQAIGMLLVGLLAGLRLSCLPLLLLPVIWVLAKSPRRVALSGALVLGILVWLLPLIAVTGWEQLLAAGLRQTEGHFKEFGGTLVTEPDLGRRLLHLFQSLLADGMGMYWPGRALPTLVVSAGLIILAAAAGKAITSLAVKDRQRLGLLLAAAVVYACWIFFFQNVIYKSRHVLPLLPLLIIALGYGARGLLQYHKLAAAAVLVLFVGGTAIVTTTLVRQHKQPTAVAQILNYLRSQNSANPSIVSVDLVRYYLEAQGLKARFISVAPGMPPDLSHWRKSDGPLYVIGRQKLGRMPEPVESRVFYHNPYVNRMWAEIALQKFE